MAKMGVLSHSDFGQLKKEYRQLQGGREDGTHKTRTHIFVRKKTRFRLFYEGSGQDYPHDVAYRAKKGVMFTYHGIHEKERKKKVDSAKEKKPTLTHSVGLFMRKVCNKYFVLIFFYYCNTLLLTGKRGNLFEIKTFVKISSRFHTIPAAWEAS